MWRQLIWSEALPPGTDLLGYFLWLLLRYHDDGWRLNEFSSSAPHFYAERNGQKQYVQITSMDPAGPKYVHRNVMDGMMPKLK